MLIKLPKLRVPRIRFVTKNGSTSRRGKNGSNWREILFSKQIREKLLFTLLVVFIYRLLASIPLPGIDMQVYQQQFGDTTASQANYLLTIFTGSQLETPSLVGLGIGVYITASIVIQLLSSVIPQLQELSKQGNRGKQVLDQYTRYLTVPLSLVYSLGYLFLILQSSGPLSGLISRLPDGSVSSTKILFMALVLTGGSLLMMWLAELITEKGVGNGASIFIMVGILASLPAFIGQDFAALNVTEAVSQVLQGNTQYLGDSGMVAIYLLIIGLLLLTLGIVWMNESTRRITIQYARRERVGGATDSNLPIKLNQSGVLPIIFASSLLSSPQLIIPVLQNLVVADSQFGQFLSSLQQSFLFQPTSTGYLVFYFVSIILLSLLYAPIALKPSDLAENFQKSGAFIPGIRPGKSTEDYVTRVLMRLTFVGGIFLAIIAIIPLVAGQFLSQISGGYTFSLFSAIGGTSILIVVGVVLDTVRQLKSLQATQNYERYV